VCREDEEILEELRETEPRFFAKLNEKELKDIVLYFHRGIVFI
jgi:hypothetical protein